MCWVCGDERKQRGWCGGAREETKKQREREREIEREKLTVAFGLLFGWVGWIGLGLGLVALRVWGSISLNHLSTEATEEKREVGR